MNEKSRAKFGLKKHRIYPMSPRSLLQLSRPCRMMSSITRTEDSHCARECTTAELSRLVSLPRQVHNWRRAANEGVPSVYPGRQRSSPLLAEAIGLAIAAVLDELEDRSSQSTESCITSQREPLAAAA